MNQDMSLYFRALADRTRLDIARYLATHDRTPVSRLGDELRVSQPLISWHLRLMRRAGVVKTKRDGRQVLCSLNRNALRTYQERVRVLLDLDDCEQPCAGDVPVRELEPTTQG